MGRELRSYRIAEMVMQKTGNKGNYADVLKRSKEMCKHFRPSLFSHVGDEYAAGVIANEILGEKIYF